MSTDIEFLSDAEKELIIQYASHDGEVTLTKEEVRKLMYEIDFLKKGKQTCPKRYGTTKSS